MNDTTEFYPGDVVHAEGSSAILGDVSVVEESGITIVWRKTVTVEQPENLIKANSSAPAAVIA